MGHNKLKDSWDGASQAKEATVYDPLKTCNWPPCSTWGEQKEI